MYSEVLSVAQEEMESGPTLEEFIFAKAAHPYCPQMAGTVGTSGTPYQYDKYGFLVHVTTLAGALQNVVPKTLQATIHYLSHYAVMAGNPGAR